ncbi:MAG TPA: hypothetical protein PKE27_19915 [Povalibacter sp.]|uniref:hypothetical protein n=1 Tax=Povalibacter sp. TaxID=1962978 RepID=UPI002B9AEA44|nr:hypothetical protein [Povalibacter sp.]HMN46855.1 hypothetical protein [Povalibacter sp.]
MSVPKRISRTGQQGSFESARRYAARAFCATLPLHEQTDENSDIVAAVNPRGVFYDMKYGIISMLRTGIALPVDGGYVTA